MSDNITIRGQVAYYMKGCGMKQKELAEKVGVSAWTISQFLSGKGNPSLELIEKIADVFDCHLSLKKKNPMV